MNSRSRAALSLPLLALLALISVVWPSVASSAAPAPTATSFELPLVQTGLGATVDLTGITATQVITIPVPAGLRPATLTGQALLSLDASTATVEVDAGDLRLGVVRLNNTASTTTVPFAVALGSAPVVGGSVSITLRTQVGFDGAYCQGQYRVPSVTLEGLTARFSGSASVPTTVADYFPAMLSHLRLWLPATPTTAQVQASLDVAAGLVARNPSSPLTVSVLTLPSSGLPPAPVFRPDTRDVVFANSAMPVTVSEAPSGDPLLVLGGTGAELQAAEQVVASNLVGLVQSSSSAITGALDPAVIPATEQTVQALGGGPLTVSGVGTVSLAVAFSQATFGGMVNRLQLHLEGSYSPVASGAESLTIAVNNQTVATQRLSGSGQFDAQPTVPLSALARDNTISLTLLASTPGGVCGDNANPIVLDLDPASTVQARLGVSQLAGFQRLPQALLPGLDVALNQSDPAEVATAVQTITALAHLSPLPLSPQVVSPAQGASASRPLVLVSDPAQVPAALRPPLDLDTGAGVVALDAPAGQIRTGTLQAASQVFTQTPPGGRARTVLLIEARSDQALLALANGLTAPTGGLGGFSDDAAVLTSTGSIQQVSISSVLTPASPMVATTASSGVPLWGWVAVGAAVVVFAISLAGGRRHRRRSARR